MKKLLCAILALMLLAASMGAQAEQADWEFDFDDYKLTGYLGEGGAVVIPERIDGCTVDILGMDLFNDADDLTSLTLPSTIKQVNENAVSFCDSLSELVIPEGVQVIEDNSFICNPALREVVIPASVRYIGKSCFGSSESLGKITFLGECPVFAGNAFDWIADGAEIYVPDDQYDAYAAALYEAECSAAVLPSGANSIAYDRTTDPSLFDFDASTGTITAFNGFDVCVEVPSEIGGVQVRSIGDQAFIGHRYLCCLTLPEGLEHIGASAFESCQTLLHIDFPSTLKTIGSRAFHTGYKGYALDLPSVESIGDEAFAWCIRITDPIDFPEGLKTIGSGAFSDCSWLSEVYLPASIESIGEKAFAGSAINYLVFNGAEMPVIAENAFENCIYLADIDLHTKAGKQEMLDMQAKVDALGLSCRVWRMQNPDVDYIEDGLDRYESGVMTAYTGTQTHIRPWDTFDDYEVTALDAGAFKGNQTIEYFAVPYNDMFTTIGAEAFADSSVRVVDLFDSVTTIEADAFRNCRNLEEMVLPESVSSVGSGALRGCVNLKKLTVLCDASVLPGDLLEGCGADMEIYAAETASDAQLKHLSAVAGRAWNNPVTRLGEQLPEVQPMPYEALPAADFWYDADFARLDRYMGYERNLVLPREIDGSTLTMVGADVMGRAMSGEDFEAELPAVSLVIPETYTEIAPYAFSNCESLETVVCYAPIELLPDGAFSNCTSLREVIFVNGVHSIGANVFDNCPNLQTVYIGPYTENISEYAFTDMNGEALWELGKCITDPAQLPDVDALLKRVEMEPIPTPEPASTQQPAVPVGAEGEPFFGVWNGVEMIMDGQSLNLADYGMTMILALLEDGRMILTDEAGDLSNPDLPDGVDAPGWRVEGGAAVGDGCTMTLMEDGRLMLDEGGMQLILERSGSQSEGAAGPADAPAPEASAPGGILGVKYICVNAEVSGYTVDASALGGEYSMTFHEGGALDFVVVGNTMPDLKWAQTESGNFTVDFYGTPHEIIWTETGFDMDYMGSMLMHFIPEG